METKLFLTKAQNNFLVFLPFSYLQVEKKKETVPPVLLTSALALTIAVVCAVSLVISKIPLDFLKLCWFHIVYNLPDYIFNLSNLSL